MKNEHKLMTLRLAVGAAGFLVCMLADFADTVELLIFLALYAVLGYDVLATAMKNIFTLKFLDENFLMAVASIGAFFIGEYHEAVSVMLFYQIGELFLKIAVNKSRKSISSLMDLNAEFANRYDNGAVETISPYDLKIGELIVVKSGEKVPVDCIITEGESMLDTAALTGESLPKTVFKGDEVLSGSVNLSAGFIAEVKKEYVDSTAMKILELAENAAHKKAKTEKFITKFAKYYTPTVVILAVLISVIPPLLASGSFTEWINRGLSFLVVSCPCALVISVPMGFFAGIGSASVKGCIVKGGVVIEELAGVKAAAFDKTGTLTSGKIKIKDVICGEDKDEILRIAAHAESFNNHPVGRAIIEYYGKAVDVSKVKETEEFIGKGVGCVFEGRRVYVGNSALMTEVGVEVSASKESVVYVAIDSQIKAEIKFGDEVKANAKESLDALRKNGIEKIVMLTGDNEEGCNAVKEAIFFDEIHCSLLPADKLQLVEQMMKNGSRRVMFVGDGINDSPVLAAADVGIAMGHSGSDAAIEAADIVVMNDDLNCIGETVKISKKTVRIIRENIVFAIGTKIFILILCSVGIVGMWAAVFADVGVAVLAVLNSLRCFKVDKRL